ncbi:MAG: winged helix-turn-helix transcriptional regulator, partial [Chloroflexi bacterium]|nr:winged helix-turn-helix transcriptional regulator [Chloroflexota bacterium]
MATEAEPKIMDSPSEALQERLVTQLKALSDPRRLSIFDMLMEGVQCNCEIAERL